MARPTNTGTTVQSRLRHLALVGQPQQPLQLRRNAVLHRLAASSSTHPESRRAPFFTTPKMGRAFLLLKEYKL